MAKIDARKCDSCGDVHPQEEMTLRTTRLEGPVLNGSYDEDVCSECIGTPPEGVTLKPLRKRTTTPSEPASEDAADAGASPSPST